MDPGGVGAIIGIGIMIGVFAGLKVCDMFKKRKKRQKRQKILSKRIVSPSDSKEEIQPILKIKRHWKMKDLELPKSFILYNLAVRKF